MQDIILASILSLIFFVGAVLGANSAYEWRDLIAVPDVLLHVSIDASLDLRDALAAISVSNVSELNSFVQHKFPTRQLYLL